MIAKAGQDMRSRLAGTALRKASLCIDLGKEVRRSQQLHENKSESERTAKVYQGFLLSIFTKTLGLLQKM